MGQGGQAFGDGPEVTQPHGIHRQAAQRGHDPHAGALAVAVRVFPELRVTRPVPGILDGPPIAHVLQQGCCCSPETRDVVTDLIDGFALADPFAAHRQDRGAAGPVLRDPLRCGHSPHGPGEVTAALAFAVAALEQRLTAVGQPIPDDPKSLAADVFNGNQEVGATLLEDEEKGRFACSASACTSKPLSSTRSSSSRRAWISLPLSVA